MRENFTLASNRRVYESTMNIIMEMNSDDFISNLFWCSEFKCECETSIFKVKLWS